MPGHELWAANAHDYGLVYGHWSMQGLHVAPRLRGLDSGCVHHGRGRDGFLTAWVPDTAQRDPFAATAAEASLWLIPANRAYYALLQKARMGRTAA